MTTDAKFAEFKRAQHAVYNDVRRELVAGRKETHWIWFIFPQMLGLGASYMSHKFGISSKAEARSYLQHELLGARLRECVRLVLSHEGRIESILGHPDDMKFRSSMTLFAIAASEQAVFQEALDKFFQGESDPLTCNLLAAGEKSTKAPNR
jgi:uncharacterized protein (DUF1810 family)